MRFLGAAKTNARTPLAEPGKAGILRKGAIVVRAFVYALPKDECLGRVGFCDAAGGIVRGPVGA